MFLSAFEPCPLAYNSSTILIMLKGKLTSQSREECIIISILNNMITWVVVPCWHLALKHGNLSTVTLQCYWQLQFPTEFSGPPSWTLTRIHFHPEVYREPFGPNMGALVVNPSPATYSTPRHQRFAWHGKPRTLQNFSIYSFCRNLSYDFFYRQLMNLMSLAMGAAIFFICLRLKCLFRI